MYSLVMMAALTAGPDVPQHWMCPVTPSNYGCGFWSKFSFYDCCAPARYGWVDCWNKGFSYYPGACPSNFGSFYQTPACCASCANGMAASSCGKGEHNWCGYGWPIGDQPAYYTSVLGCPPCVTAPPYAYYTERDPCCRHGQFAFDSGLIGHSHGVGYAGFGGYGNFGFYGAVPMAHPPTTADLPPFPRPDYRSTTTVPSKPAPLPPIPKGSEPPAPPSDKKEPKKDEPKKDEGKKPLVARPAPATMVLSLPAGARLAVEGQDLSGAGGVRTFRTPDLEPGQEYAYTVTATLLINERAEIETLQVEVSAGEISRASFEKLFALTAQRGRRTLADGARDR
jgi:uncharacterized protein (TIGR03000 family)